jgi:hypothetical protein
MKDSGPGIERTERQLRNLRRLNGKTTGSEEILCARAPVQAADKPSGGGRISLQNKISRRQFGQRERQLGT